MKYILKYKRNMFILVLTCTIISYFSLTSLADENQDEQRYGRNILSTMSNSESLLYAYDQLVEGIENYEDNICIIDSENGLSITAEELEDFVYEAYYSDYPQHFWLSDGCYNYCEFDGKVTSVDPNYAYNYCCDMDVNNNYNDIEYTKEEIDVIYDKIEKKAEEMIDGLEGKSDYDKALIIHDRLIKNIDYEHSKNAENIYGALINGKSICTGYAKAYQYLLDKVGIKAWSVRGDSIIPDTDEREAHCWNLVNLDGKWYYTDVTWDDQGNTDDTTFYRYFNMTTEDLKNNYELNKLCAGNVPECTSNDYNYFNYNSECVINSDIQSEEFTSSIVDKVINEGYGRYFVSDADESGNSIYTLLEKIDLAKLLKKVPLRGNISFKCLSLGKEYHFFVSCLYGEKNGNCISYTATQGGTLVIAQYCNGRMTNVWSKELAVKSTANGVFEGKHYFAEKDGCSYKYKLFLMKKGSCALQLNEYIIE